MRLSLSVVGLAALSSALVLHHAEAQQQKQPFQVVNPASAPATPTLPAEVRVATGQLFLNDYLDNSGAAANTRSDVEATPQTVHPDSPAPGLSYISTYNTCGQTTSTATLVCEYDANSSSTSSTYPTTDYKIYEVVVIHGYGNNLIGNLVVQPGTNFPAVP